MLTRVLTMTLITGFWAVMWTLLIRSELRPDETSLRLIPVEVVLRQFFEHEQPSDLFLHANGESIGHLRLGGKPRTGGYSMQYFGNAQVTPSGQLAQRVFWEGELELDRAFHPERLRGAFHVRGLPSQKMTPVRTDYSLEPAANRGWYRYSVGDDTVAEQTFTLDQAGVNSLLEEWGITPEITRQFAPAATAAGAVEFGARQGHLTVHGEPIDANIVTVKMQGQTWLELHLSQSGQVLEASTLWGWTLDAE